MIDFIFLDIDDTVFDFGYAEAEALREVLLPHGIVPTEVEIRLYSEINDSHWKRLERGELTRDEVRIGRFEVFFDRMGIANVSARQTNELFMRAVTGYTCFHEGARELLDALRARGKRLFVASNATASVQYERLRSAGIDGCFEAIFLSEEIGSQKPQREFFERCFASISNFDPSRAIILGDSLTSDILGGINAGIKTCWFNPKRKPCREDIVPDFEIASLLQFLDPSILN